MRVAWTVALTLLACSDDAVPAGTSDGDVALEVEHEIEDAHEIEDTQPIETEVGHEVDVAEVASGGCFDDPSPGHQSIACGDITFEVEVPTTCAQRACGLILDIHGLTMTGELEDANTKMRERGRSQSYVVIQPTAPSILGLQTWNLQTHADPIFAFAERVAAVVGTDPDRAYVMGFSQGGDLTWQLVCKHADWFAAASPLGALPGCSFDGADVPSREVPMLIVHGRKDTVVAFSLLESQRDAALGYWPFGGPTVVADDGAHKVTRWTTPSGTPLEVWEHDYTATSLLLNGHCVPGSPHLVAFPLAFGCQQPGTFVWGEVAMAFFAAHVRQLR